MTDNEKYWHPLSHLTKNHDKIGLILLNTPIPFNVKEIKTLWKKAVVKGVADGALNRLHELNESCDLDLIPDYVCGDFDSIEPHLLSMFEKKGTEIISKPDQDSTDFTKALDTLVTLTNEVEMDMKAVYVVLSYVGRLDHIFGAVQTLFLHKKKSKIPVYLYTNDSISWLLSTGIHRIFVNTGKEDQHCGLIPIGKPVKCSTWGLKWNLMEEILEFGGVVATSNELDGSQEVTVKTDGPLLWTLSLKHMKYFI